LALSIASNTNAEFASNALRSTGARVATAVERLSTGERINSAKDDAAGLAIGDRFLAKLNAASQAVRNVNDGISMLQVAEGAVNGIVESLQRIRELAVQAANAPLTASDRKSLQAEVDQLYSQSLNQQNQAQFNNIPLLDGSFTGKQFQIGDGFDDQLSLELPKLFTSVDVTTPGYTIPAVTEQVTTTVTSPRSYVVKAGAGLSGALAAGDLTLNGTAVPAPSAGALPGQDANSAWALAQSISSVSAASGVSVISTSTVKIFTFVPGNPGASIPAGAITLNGVPVPAFSGTTVQDLVNDMVNKMSSISGLTGTAAGQFSGPNQFALVSLTGRNIDVQETVPGAVAMTNVLTLGLARGRVILGTASSVAPFPNLVIGGTNPSASGFIAGSYSANAADTPLVTTSTTTVVISPEIQVPATTVSSYPTPDITTQQEANITIATMDALIEQLNSARTGIGASLNRMAAVTEQLLTSGAGMSAARSRVMDADYAQEMANLAGAQIIANASTAMLAQAKIPAQFAIDLLKSL